MRRLYLQIYVVILAVLLLFSALWASAWYLARSESDTEMLDELGAVVAEVLPAADRPLPELQQALERLSAKFGADLAVRAPGGQLLAAAGRPIPGLPDGDLRRGWLRRPWRAPGLILRLPDDRWFVARDRRRRPRRGPLVGLAGLGLLALAVAIGAYPLSRRLAGRLERLRARVEGLGRGDLASRVDVEGNDEVADLARAFNRSAERLQRLVEAQRGMLASASHELRSPLARLRVAIELLGGVDRPDLRARIASDIAELDELVAEILLASRLEALDAVERSEDVDLLALLAEEGARVEATVEGEPVHVRGDARLLRRLVRNLLDNARRHAEGSGVEVRLQATAGGARIAVADRGPGVPEGERDRIFEPFYRPAGMRESGGGVGLGLALVRQIARHHGGDAECHGREGGGSVFVVTLASGER